MSRKNKNEPDYGGFILTFEPGRCERIDTALRYYRHEATETFSASDWKFLPRELVLVSLGLDASSDPDELAINGAALMERTKVGGATGKLKMRLHSPVMFEQPIELAELPKYLWDDELFSTSLDLRRIPPSTWRDLLDHIRAVRPGDAQAMRRLELQRSEDRRVFPSSARAERLMEQRDAIGVAIDIAGLDRPNLLKTWNPHKVAEADSALDPLDTEPLQEQDAIRQDQVVFGNLLTRGMRHARFSNDYGREVRIHVYDRKPLESVLGIDLLIYLALYKSYILIQYKMMDKSSNVEGKWYYPVDSHLLEQLRAMNRAAGLMHGGDTDPTSMIDWRLADEVFFWRFCEATRQSDSEGSLVHGITLSRPHLNSFLTLPEAKELGGSSPRIGYGNCRRYLSTSQFIELAQAGWIGGGARAYRFIEALLEKNQTAGRQTLLAFISQAEELRKLGRTWRAS
jgi:hypothetical protein